MNETNFTCSICLEDNLQIDYAIILPCQHKFCLSCIKTWLVVNPCCPLDRSEITNILIHHNPIDAIHTVSVADILIDHVSKNINALIENHLPCIIDLLKHFTIHSEKLITIILLLKDYKEKFTKINFQKILFSNSVKSKHLFELFSINYRNITMEYKYDQANLGEFLANQFHAFIEISDSLDEKYKKYLENRLEFQSYYKLVKRFLFCYECFITMNNALQDNNASFNLSKKALDGNSFRNLIKKYFLKNTGDDIENLIKDIPVIKFNIDIVGTTIHKISKNKVCNIEYDSLNKCRICEKDNQSAMRNFVCSDCMLKYSIKSLINNNIDLSINVTDKSLLEYIKSEFVNLKEIIMESSFKILQLIKTNVSDLCRPVDKRFVNLSYSTFDSELRIQIGISNAIKKYILFLEHLFQENLQNDQSLLQEILIYKGFLIELRKIYDLLFNSVLLKLRNIEVKIVCRRKFVEKYCVKIEMIKMGLQKIVHNLRSILLDLKTNFAEFKENNSLEILFDLTVHFL